MDAEDGIKVVEKRRYHLWNRDGMALVERKGKKKHKILGKVFFTFAICHVWQQRGNGGRRGWAAAPTRLRCDEQLAHPHQGCRLTCATERCIHHVGGRQRFAWSKSIVFPCRTRTCKKRGGLTVITPGGARETYRTVHGKNCQMCMDLMAPNWHLKNH